MSRIALLVFLVSGITTSHARASDAALTPEAAALIQPVIEALVEITRELDSLPAAKDDAERLIRLARVDAAGRTAYRKLDFLVLPESQRLAAFNAARAEIDKHDLENQKELKRLLPPEGWFLKSKYGEESAKAAWRIVTNAFKLDPGLMRTALAGMERHLLSGEVDKASYANLYDHVAMADGKFQRYGTHTICRDHKWALYPIEDPANADKRRADMDIKTPLAEELSSYTGTCPVNYDGPLPN
jgi:hypothetical protein